jgi:hypothetical protein
MPNFGVYWISLCMFRTVFPSIIGNSRLYRQHQIYIIQVSWLLASGCEMEQEFQFMDMHNFRVYWISLYMIRTVFPSIIGSSRLYKQHHIYVIQVSWLLASGCEMEQELHFMEHSFHLVPTSKQSTNLYDIYLMLCVQSWTSDNGRKSRPKHLERYSINSKIVHLFCLTVEI